MTTNPWVPHDVEFFCDLDRPDYAVALWAGHRWFGYDLVRWAKPKRIVELGTHYGCSFFAFCQALLAERSDCEIMGVDTWEGDGHTQYHEEVYGTFTSILERRFAAVQARVQQSTFDDALPLVADGSVDILHVDGLHTYDAVRHDYESWQDKVAPNGIVLFHDVAPSSGLGSAQYWQEIKETGPGFAFMHSLGLGILLPNGTEGREALLELGRSHWRPYYEHRAGHDLRSRQVIDLTAMVDSRDEALTATDALVADRDEALAKTQVLVDARDEALAETQILVDARDAALTATELMVANRDESLDASAREIARRDELLAAAQQTLGRREDELTAIHQQAAKTDSELAKAIEERNALQQLVDQVSLDSAAESEHLHHHIAALTEDRDSVAATLDLYKRTLRPVRWAARPPRKVLRQLRGRYLEHGQEHELPGLVAETSQEPVALEHLNLFDSDWYVARYPDIARAGIDPLQHWRDYGWTEGREPCPLFNAGSYLETNPDVAEARHDPLAHWAESGWKENRNPSPLFATEFYRDRQPALSSGDTNPLQHYFEHGMGSGEFISPEHEERVLAATPPAGSDDELLVDIVVHNSDGTNRSIPSAMIADLDADLFTFDLWDSILRRSRPADSSKLATARRLRLAVGFGPNEGPTTWELMRRRVEIEAEIAGPANGEYLLGDVLTRLVGEIATGDQSTSAANAASVDIPALADSLRWAELKDEMLGTTPISETVLVMEKLLGRGDAARVAVLSDFYLGAEDLRELLSYHGLADDRLQVFSSADVGQSKHKGGALFDWVREQYGVEASRHVHIGDNPHADVAMQTATGGIAVHLSHGRRRFVGPGQLDEQTMNGVAAELGSELGAAAELRCREGGLRPRPQNRILRAAWQTALLPVALVAAAIEDASARGIDRVHYLSREGLFLSRIHDEVASILMPQNHPAAVHLAVSRRSTFGPSLADLSPESLMDLWRMYSRQTPRGLLVSLGADVDDFTDAARRFDMSLDEVIDGVHLDPRIRSFLDDGEVGRRLQELNSTRRTALLNYLGHQTDLSASELIVVDVGWRGTVQDNLARLLPDAALRGWYLALFPFLNPQLDNCAKFAVGPDGNQNQEFAHMEPPAAVERPWTPAAPSVVDYRLSGGQAAVPVLDEEVLNDRSRAAIAMYQDAVIDAVPTIAKWIVANGAATDVLRPIVEQQLADYYARPEPGIADLWFDSAHDDTFGVLNVTSFGKDRPGPEWLSGGPGPGFLRKVEDAASASLWPAGYRRWLPVEAATAVDRALRTQSFRTGR